MHVAQIGGVRRSMRDRTEAAHHARTVFEVARWLRKVQLRVPQRPRE
jgi:hypothetical protein